MQDTDGTQCALPEPIILLSDDDLYCNYALFGAPSMQALDAMLRPGQRMAPLSEYANSPLMLNVVRFNNLDYEPPSSAEWLASSDVWVRIVLQERRPSERCMDL